MREIRHLPIHSIPLRTDPSLLRLQLHILTLGALKLESTSLIDLGNGTSTLRFAESSAAAWTGTLGIRNRSGLTHGGGDGKLFFRSISGGLSVDQVAQIAFIDSAGFEPGTYNATMLPTGEIVAVPEPGSLAPLVGAIGLLGFRRRRRS